MSRVLRAATRMSPYFRLPWYADRSAYQANERFGDSMYDMLGGVRLLVDGIIEKSPR